MGAVMPCGPSWLWPWVLVPWLWPCAGLWRRQVGHGGRQPRLGPAACRGGGGAAPAGVFGLQLGRVALFNDQAVVVVQLFARLDIAQRGDENAAVPLIGKAVGVAAVVDPAGRVAAMVGVDHPVFIHMEVKRVVGLAGVMGWRSCASCQLMISPVYSTSTSPAAMSCRAKLPCRARLSAGLDAAAGVGVGVGRRCIAGHG